jgi:tyrosine-specific transport protein
MSKRGKLVDRDYLLAFGVMVGTAIGAGIFGLPFVVSRAGFLPSMLLLMLLGILTLVSNLMYGEITLRTKGRCRLVGYSDKYLGPWGKQIAAVTSFLSFYASLLVYMILGGVFLHAMFSPLFGGDVFSYSLIIFIFSSVAIYLNLNLFSVIESWMTALLIIVVFIVIFKSLPAIDTSNFLTADPHYFFLPFGAMLFSLGAMSSIPELEHIIRKRKGRIKNVIISSTIFYTLIYIFFIIAVLGVTGNQTTEESFVGLSRSIGDGVVVLGFIFGFLAIATSYLMTGISLKEIFWYDYGISEKRAWFLTCFVPLFIFLLGLRDFIQIITFAGSITGGISGILVTLIFYRAKVKGDTKPAFEFNFSKTLSSVIILVYVLGMFYQLIYE